LIVTCAGKEYVIPTDYEGLATVGRGVSCQICVDSSFASRLHGCFRCTQEQFTYRDMSSNGTTLLEGHEEVLVHDDEVPLPKHGSLRIGDTVLSFIVVES
jgi:pSer/pThr/pTyr-binding forkhead associated (FHA) protein